MIKVKYKKYNILKNMLSILNMLIIYISGMISIVNLVVILFFIIPETEYIVSKLPIIGIELMFFIFSVYLNRYLNKNDIDKQKLYKMLSDNKYRFDSSDNNIKYLGKNSIDKKYYYKYNDTYIKADYRPYLTSEKSLLSFRNYFYTEITDFKLDKRCNYYYEDQQFNSLDELNNILPKKNDHFSVNSIVDRIQININEFTDDPFDTDLRDSKQVVKF